MKKSYQINGMHCAGCVQSVEKSLKNVPGVKSVSVQLATENAVIESGNGDISFDKLREAVEQAGFELENPEIRRITLNIEGMHCAGCMNSIEKSLLGLDGVISANVNLTTAKAIVEYNEGTTGLEEIQKAVEEAGYSSKPKENNTNRLEEKREREEKKYRTAKNNMIWSWVVTAPIMVWMFVHMVLGLHLTNPLVMELAMVLGAGFVIFKPGLQTLVSAWKSAMNTSPNMDVLIAIGTVASLVTGFVALGYELGFIESQFYSFAGIAAMIMAFHLTGRYVETKARGRASEAITKLLTLEAKSARIIKNGIEEEVPVEELKQGDVMIIRPGEKIPTDGEVVDGKSSIDEAMVTGESMPVLREKGDKVIGGTINTDGNLRVKATEVGENTFLNRVIKLVEEAQGSKIPIQEFADKVTSVFVPVILVLAFLTFITWLILPETLRPLLVWADGFLPWIITDLAPMSQAFFVALAVLVIACPCALGLATPTALMVGTGLGAENGILIRRGEAIQRLEQVTTFVFDKTGTLTKGEPEVVEWKSFKKNEKEVIQLAASVENMSEHPISKAITNYSGTENFVDVQNFESYTGMGVKAEAGGQTILAGNIDLLKKFSISTTNVIRECADTYHSKGYTAIYIVTDNEVAAIAGISDPIKEETPAMLEKIHEMGYKTVMLTGDQSKVAEIIAEKIGIDKVIAEVKPDEKSAMIKELQDNGEVVAMVGDGINDAPALSQADVGIALGTGTDIAIESGSIILVDGNPEVLIRAVLLSRATFLKIRQNLFWAFFYNVIMIPVAMVGWMHPVIAEAAMAMSSINVVWNSRRLQNKSIN